MNGVIYCGSTYRLARPYLWTDGGCPVCVSVMRTCQLFFIRATEMCTHLLFSSEGRILWLTHPLIPPAPPARSFIHSFTFAAASPTCGPTSPGRPRWNCRCTAPGAT